MKVSYLQHQEEKVDLDQQENNYIFFICYYIILYNNMSGIHIYKGKAFIMSYIKKNKELSKKVITFDLDETLGSFGELYILWKAISDYYQMVEQFHDMSIIFHKLMDLYPEFLRHGILNILGYLYNKKLSGECSKVFLYTNNNCYGSENSKWLSFLIGYIHNKICYQNTVLFDKIICAFKINNQVMEPMRTTHNKTYSDFIRCSLLPKSAEVCFIDNTYYEKMLNDRVYYIQPRSYYHMLSKEVILGRLEKQWKSPALDYSFIRNKFSKYSLGSRKPTKVSVDIMISQKIMYHLKEFFLLSTRGKKTKKILVRLGRFTRKLRT